MRTVNHLNWRTAPLADASAAKVRSAPQLPRVKKLGAENQRITSSRILRRKGMIQTASQDGVLDATFASGTSALLLYRPRPQPQGVVIGLEGLSESTTSSDFDMYWPVNRTAPNLPGHCSVAEVESIAAAVMEVRRRSGLTWEELSEVFDVSRRSVHNWASGKVVSTEHERVIRRVLAAIRRIDRGTQVSTRATLLEVDAQTGRSMLDQLKAKQFGAVMVRGTASYRREQRSTPVSQEAWNARRPPAPRFLLQAERDRPDVATKTRAVSVTARDYVASDRLDLDRLSAQ